ncbi:CPBP family intramembrane glutamic endopeptidase [Microbacterium sp. 5K110]|jgi:membrane protease YdiL (CAAX protease family)|uniref:CPBP family intramembrane glutamic endopeptidase n=1 Tax=unclassified Microbacterium TaxID=2609290 RepID=UPI0010FDDB44|nr:CPBP family intramembrane glutamic endopeptidase [Microbacterium sp. 5K110]TLF32778.1 CPBP family intramembrane metalloprotease [Microbacterium sp. 5K110]
MTSHAVEPEHARRTWTAKLVPAVVVCLAAPVLFVVQIVWLGWIVLALAVASAVVVDRRAGVPIRPGQRSDPVPSIARDVFLIALGQFVVSLIPLKAELDDAAFVRFTLALGGAVLLPYVLSRFVFHDRAIRFPWRGGGRWAWWQWAWLAGVIVLGWLILPFYFVTSGVYMNWPVVDTPELIARLFVGVGAVGIWDELFFVCTVFALLRRHFPDVSANVLQAIVFVSFLWELGYQAWGPVLTIPFALVQGFLFLRTRSLWYVVTVHLLFDAVVFGVLVHAHNPDAVSIFLI